MARAWTVCCIDLEDKLGIYPLRLLPLAFDAARCSRIALFCAVGSIGSSPAKVSHHLLGACSPATFRRLSHGGAPKLVSGVQPRSRQNGLQQFSTVLLSRFDAFQVSCSGGVPVRVVAPVPPAALRRRRLSVPVAAAVAAPPVAAPAAAPRGPDVQGGAANDSDGDVPELSQQ